MTVRPGPYRPERFGFDPAICWGVHLGGCVEMGPEEVHKQVHLAGHAHTNRGCRWRGWICIIDPAEAFTRLGNPSRLVLHEYAHLICGDAVGHGATWKRVVAELGAGTEAKRYAKAK